jgi:hypothetical protein
MMDEAVGRDMRRLASAVGVVAVGSAVCLAIYFAAGGPFGTLNDIGNAATGALSAGLAWRLRGQIPGRSGAVATGAALTGAAITVVGSALVVSGTTGWFLAGLVSTVGFAGIGAWLVVLNRQAGLAAGWPRRLPSVGVAAGALMGLGILSLPGIVLGFDDPATAPGWAWIASIAWLGIYVVYPAWALWLGVVESRRAGRSQRASLTPQAR